MVPNYNLAGFPLELSRVPLGVPGPHFENHWSVELHHLNAVSDHSKGCKHYVEHSQRSLIRAGKAACPDEDSNIHYQSCYMHIICLLKSVVAVSDFHLTVSSLHRHLGHSSLTVSSLIMSKTVAFYLLFYFKGNSENSQSRCS